MASRNGSVKLTSVISRKPSIVVGVGGIVGNNDNDKAKTESTLTIMRSADDDGDGEKDVDRGWAWVVLFSAFTSLIIFGGQQYGFASYFVVFLQEFNETRSYTSWAGGLQAAVFHFTGPLTSILLPVIGSRALSILGGLSMAAGFLLLYFAQSMLYIILVYGILVGIGSCFVLTGSLASCARFFDKRLFIANGVTFSGTGIGFLTVGLASEYLIKFYGWRGSLFIQAGICLQVCIFAALVFAKVERRPPTRATLQPPTLSAKDVTTITNSDTDTENAVEKPEPKPEVRRIKEYFMESRFWCLNASTLLVNMGCLSVLIFFKDMLQQKNLDIYDTVLIALGSGSTIGRFSGGFISSCFNPMLFYFTLAVVNTVNVAVFPLMHSLAGYATVAFVFGVCQGSAAVLQSIQLIKVYSRAELPLLWGLGMGYGSIGVLAGPPIFGYLKDKTGVYTGSLFMCSAVIFLAGVFAAIVYLIERKRKHQKPVTTMTDVECPQQQIVDT